MHDMIEVSQYVDDMVNGGKGRTEAVKLLASKLNVGVPTLYRWLKTGDHFICDNDNGSLFSAYQLVACQEK